MSNVAGMYVKSGVGSVSCLYLFGHYRQKKHRIFSRLEGACDLRRNCEVYIVGDRYVVVCQYGMEYSQPVEKRVREEKYLL